MDRRDEERGRRLPPLHQRLRVPKILRHTSPSLLGFLSILLFVGSMASIIAVGYFVSYSYGDPDGRKGAEVLDAVLLYIAVQKAVLLSVLMTILLFEWKTRRVMSKLLPIFVLSELTNEGYLMILAARALDALHEPMVTWQALYTPTTRTLLVLFVAALPFVDMLFIGTIARGYGWGWRRIVTDFVLIALLVAIVEYLLIVAL